MHETPALPSAPEIFTPDKPPTKKFRQKFILVIAALVVVAGLTASALVYLRPSAQSTVADSRAVPSIAFYYRDGKSLIWHGKASDVNSFAPATVVHAYDELLERFGGSIVNKGAWQVTTSFDQSLQATAEAQIKAQHDQLLKQHAADAVLVAQDVTNGQIVAWAQGLDGTTIVKSVDRLEVGTLMLPFTYAALLEKTNAGAGTVFDDSQGVLPGYSCTNLARPTSGGNCLFDFDFNYVGQLTLRQALGTERLVPAVKAAVQIPGGPQVVTDKLQQFADTLTDNQSHDDFSCYSPGASLDQQNRATCYTAASYGAGLYARPQTVLQAYATLANNDKKAEQTTLLKVMIDGKLGYESSTKTTDTLRPDTAYILNDILTDPNASYLTTKKQLFAIGSTKVGVMSGLADSAKVAGAVQYSPKYAVGFWSIAGQDSSQQLVGLSDQVTLPVTSEWLMTALSGTSYPDRAKPSGVQMLPSIVTTVNLPYGTVGPSPSQDLYPSWYK